MLKSLPLKPLIENLSRDRNNRTKRQSCFSAPARCSGNPDFVDKMVASTFAGMAMDCIEIGEHGLMMAISSGCYAAVPIPDPKLGPRKVDVESMYNIQRFRPNYARKLGLPIFLT